MKTTLEKRDGKMVATLIGELNTAAAIDVEKGLQPLYESKEDEGWWQQGDAAECQR